MSAACLDAPRLDSYLADALDRAERSAATEHLRSCADCRLRALEIDPSVVFRLALSAGPAVSEEESRQILENVRVAISIRQASRRIEPAPAGPGMRRTAAALAAAALLSLTVSSPKARRPASAARVSSAAAAAPSPSAFARATAPDRSDEALAPATATVYEWNPGANSPDDPKIVWIVDRSLDL